MWDNPWIITIAGGIIVGIIILLLTPLMRRGKNTKKESKALEDPLQNNQLKIADNLSMGASLSDNLDKSQTDFCKRAVKILFVDDDLNFRIVSILKKQGWINTKIVGDILNIDKYHDYDIFFIDINGVGKLMALQDEGLDLAYLIKKKYPNKMVVIYSTDTKRDVTHQAFKIVDGTLPKNAQIYEFENYIEDFSKRLL